MAKKNLYPTTKKRKGGAKNITAAVSKFFSDGKFLLSVGVVFMLAAVVLFFAFLSHFFTGEADQSLVESVRGVASSGQKPRNWLGTIGAIVSYYFVFKWFGVNAFLFIPLLFNAGYKIVFQRRLFYDWAYVKLSLFIIFWFGAVLGYAVLATETESSWGAWCGGIGYAIAETLNNMMGWATVFVLIAAIIVYLIFVVDNNTLDRFKITPPDEATRRAREAEKENIKKEKERELAAKYNLRQQQEEQKQQNNPQNANNKNGNQLVLDDDVDSAVVFQGNANVDLAVENLIETPPKNKANFDFSVDNGAIIEEDLDDELPEVKQPLHIKFGNYDPRLDLSSYQFPEAELLDPPVISKARVTKEELEGNKDRIVETLSHFKIGISSIKATIGPTVTLYEIVPQAGIKISKIKNLEDDIALNLSALGIRIIAPIPGRGTIGIEVPNKNREIVSMSSLISSVEFQESEKALPIVLGKTISNQVFITDLTKMPHLLMAGATGQGKSVGLNVIIASLLYKKHPSELKFVLIDPKKVELTLYNKIERHFLATLPNSEEAIITDTKKVVHTLNSLCIEMDVRYNLLKDAGCRNIKEYNQKFTLRKLNPEEGHRFLPYIILIIDELADLMMTAGKEVETPIARLAQLARAIGIHLIVATQRPSVNVITGIIKANFPARLSFKVTSRIDSRTILDTSGAEQLTGMGDMLLSNGSDIIRLQCAFVDTHEIERVCEFIGGQRGFESSYLLPEFEDEAGETKSVDLNNRDSMFEEAARLVVTHQQGSTSLIQRKLSLGYNRAGRIMDQLEAAGVVGAFEGSKARKVLINDAYALEQLIKALS